MLLDATSLYDTPKGLSSSYSQLVLASVYNTQQHSDEHTPVIAWYAFCPPSFQTGAPPRGWLVPAWLAQVLVCLPQGPRLSGRPVTPCEESASLPEQTKHNAAIMYA